MPKLLIRLFLVYLVVIGNVSLAFTQTDIELEAFREQCNQLLVSAKTLEQQFPDSAIQLSSDALAIAVLHSLTDEEIRANICIGDIYLITGDLERAMQQFTAARSDVDDATRSIPDDPNLNFYAAEILSKLGLVHLKNKRSSESLAYFDQAMSILEEIDAVEVIDQAQELKIKILNNMAGAYIVLGNYEKALAYFKPALAINAEKRNLQIESSIENNIGICYMELGQYDLATHHLLKSLEARKEGNDRQGLAQNHNNIGKNYILQGNFSDALFHYETALRLGKETGADGSVIVALESLSTLNDTLHNYREALGYFREYHSLRDSLFNLESNLKIAKVEEQYRLENQQKLFELELARKDAEEEKRSAVYYAVAGISFFLLLTAFLIILLMKGRVKRANLEKAKIGLESENLSLVAVNLQESIDSKDRELTAKALFMLKNNEMITNITEKLISSKLSFKAENQQIVNDILVELKSNQDFHLWEEFEIHFTNVHRDFYARLHEKFPSLTANEKKLCAFLKLNMSSKDISAITYQSVNSITVARSRLRKKLNIEGDDIHLVNFLMDF